MGEVVIRTKNKFFVHYIDKDKSGRDINIHGMFEIVKEAKNFLVIKTDKNLVRIPYHRIIKVKGGKL